MKKKTITLNFATLFSIVIVIGIIITAIVVKTKLIPEESIILTYQAKEQKATATTSTTVIGTWDISATENDNVTATLYEDGKLSITGTGNMKNWSSNSDVAWKDKTNQITSVEISNSVTSIGNYTFTYCTSLTSITIPSSVTSIGYDAFYNCTSLTSITIPSSVTTIASSTFSSCTSLTSITIPSSVISIDNSAFKYCSNVTIYCEEGSYAKQYAGSNNISYKIGTMPTDMGPWDISEDGNNSVTATLYEDGKLSITGTGKMKNWSSSSNVPWKDKRSQITSIEISNSVTSIGSSAFYNCSSLTTISIPNSVTSIDIHAFSYCSGLTSINVNQNNANYSSTDGILFNKDKTTIIQYPEGKKDVVNYIIPSSVTTIGSYTFQNCYSLKTITIPSSVTTIETSPFYNCSNLTIYCEEDSSAEEYAIEKNIPYEIIEIKEDIQINKIVIKTEPNKTDYIVGDTLDTSGLVLTATYNNGTTKEITTGYTCTPMSLTNVGNQNILVTYEGQTVTFEVTVRENENQGGNGNEGGDNNQSGDDNQGGDNNQGGDGNQGGDNNQSGDKIQNGSSSQKVSTNKDKTSSNPQTVTSATTPKELPKTGVSSIWIIAAIIVTIIGIISYIQYKRIRKI